MFKKNNFALLAFDLEREILQRLDACVAIVGC